METSIKVPLSILRPVPLLWRNLTKTDKSSGVWHIYGAIDERLDSWFGTIIKEAQSIAAERNLSLVPSVYNLAEDGLVDVPTPRSPHIYVTENPSDTTQAFLCTTVLNDPDARCLVSYDQDEVLAKHTALLSVLPRMFVVVDHNQKLLRQVMKRCLEI